MSHQVELHDRCPRCFQLFLRLTYGPIPCNCVLDPYTMTPLFAQQCPDCIEPIRLIVSSTQLCNACWHTELQDSMYPDGFQMNPRVDMKQDLPVDDLAFLPNPPIGDFGVIGDGRPDQKTQAQCESPKKDTEIISPRPKSRRASFRVLQTIFEKWEPEDADSESLGSASIETDSSNSSTKSHDGTPFQPHNKG